MENEHNPPERGRSQNMQRWLRKQALGRGQEEFLFPVELQKMIEQGEETHVRRDSH